MSKNRIIEDEMPFFWPIFPSNYYQQSEDGTWNKLPHSVGKALYKQQQLEDKLKFEAKLDKIYQEMLEK